MNPPPTPQTKEPQATHVFCWAVPFWPCSKPRGPPMCAVHILFIPKSRISVHKQVKPNQKHWAWWCLMSLRSPRNPDFKGCHLSLPHKTRTTGCPPRRSVTQAVALRHPAGSRRQGTDLVARARRTHRQWHSKFRSPTKIARVFLLVHSTYQGNPFWNSSFSSHTRVFDSGRRLEYRF